MRLSKLGRVGVLSQERTARGESLYVGDQRDKGGGSGIDSGRPAREEKKKPKKKTSSLYLFQISSYVGEEEIASVVLSLSHRSGLVSGNILN